MDSTRRRIAFAACWALVVGSAVWWTAHGAAQERANMIERFAARADAGSTFTAAYVDDVFALEGRMASSLAAAPVTDATLSRVTGIAGFTAVVLLDARGRVVAATPSNPELLGKQLAATYPHLGSALTGRPTVSDVVLSAVESAPIVAFALPLEGGRAGVLSGGYDFRESPLRTFLSKQPIPGTRGYILDSTGVPAVYGGDGATLDPPDAADEAATSGPVISGDRVTASVAIDGTPWHFVLDAPVSNVTAPATQNDRSGWLILAGVALLFLLGLAVLDRLITSRSRIREKQAESDQRYRLTVENAPIGMTTVDLEGRLVAPNQRLCRLLGYSYERLNGMTFQSITHPEDVQADVDLLERLTAGEITHYEMEKRYVRGDGSVVWARLTVSVVRDSQGAPVHFVSQVEDVTEIRAAQEKLEQQALYDPLTGLANRSLLLDRLAHALRRRSDTPLVGVAFCDLDHFKRVNDSLGHHAGDLLLREVARRLESAVRGVDTVARMGGDEFVLLLPDVESVEVASVIVERARAAVEAPLLIEGHSLNIAFSAGLTLSSDGRSAEALLREADTALYAAKGAGRSRCEIYTSAMRSRALLHLSVESELQRAFEQDELELHYQPIVELESRRTVAFEALVRWRHPTRGMLLPGSFIDVAEASQLIMRLGEVTLHKAIAFLARHPEASWRVYVNVSPAQLGRDLDGLVRSELAAAGVPALRLGLEITENGVLQATGSSLGEMERLREMGVGLLMDDFGTGYSALSSVLTTPITGLKLDRSFIARLGDDGPADRITSTVADLVRSLGFHGVAEGIETEGQRVQALTHGWMLGQGYLFARPTPEAMLVIPERQLTDPVASGRPTILARAAHRNE